MSDKSMSKGSRQIAENIYALAKTNKLLMFRDGTKITRPLTETEWRYIHKDGNVLNEGVGTLEYSVYLESVKPFSGRMLSDTLSESICKEHSPKSILHEAQRRFTKQQLKEKNETYFMERIINEIKDIT